MCERGLDVTLALGGEGLASRPTVSPRGVRHVRSGFRRFAVVGHGNVGRAAPSVGPCRSTITSITGAGHGARLRRRLEASTCFSGAANNSPQRVGSRPRLALRARPQATVGPPAGRETRAARRRALGARHDKPLSDAGALASPTPGCAGLLRRARRGVRPPRAVNASRSFVGRLRSHLSPSLERRLSRPPCRPNRCR